MAISGRSARLEHRLTRPNASLADLDAAVELARRFELSALVVSPWLVRHARRRLGRSAIRVGTVVSFPDGTQLFAVKAYETSKALESGAAQIDFVLNAGALVSGEDEAVYNDMLAVVDMAHSALAPASVIVAADVLGPDLVGRACRLAERSGADMVVTSTGEAAARTTIDQVSLLRDSVGPRVGVKAAGRFRSVGDLERAAEAGASAIVAEFDAGLLDVARHAPALVGVG